jgi:hypothetical protein
LKKWLKNFKGAKLEGKSFSPKGFRQNRNFLPNLNLSANPYEVAKSFGKSHSNLWQIPFCHFRQIIFFRQISAFGGMDFPSAKLSRKSASYKVIVSEKI